LILYLIDFVANSVLNTDTIREAKFDGFVKSPIIVMPDLIRHPEPVEFIGFRLPPE